MIYVFINHPAFRASLLSKVGNPCGYERFASLPAEIGLRQTSLSAETGLSYPPRQLVN